MALGAHVMLCPLTRHVDSAQNPGRTAPLIVYIKSSRAEYRNPHSTRKMDKHRTLFPGAMAQEGLGVVHKSKLPRDIAQSINSGDADTRQGVGPMLPKKPNTAETQPNKLRKTVFAINLPTNSSSPWDRYQPILIENQAGTATLAHGNNPSFPIVAIKCRKCSPEELRHVTQCRHENITAFTETYHHDDQIYFIYECVMMSLAEVQSTPCNDFAPYEIAAVSKAILTGLNYLQSSLDISHGALCSSNIVFALWGQGHLSIQIGKLEIVLCSILLTGVISQRWRQHAESNN